MTRLLHVEDEVADSDLVSLWLHEAGLDWDVVRVDTREGFVNALEHEPFDLVLSDFQLPAFNGHDALRETRLRRPELAFVFFTATLGEERAVDALKAGATDFVAKERPERLVPALTRAVGESQERAARRRAEQELREREASFRLLFESNPHSMWVFDLDTLWFLEVNAAAVAHYGYSRDEFLAMRITDIRPPDEVGRAVLAVRNDVAAGVQSHTGSWQHLLKDGRVIDVEVVAHDIVFGGRAGRLVVAHDVTERTRLEAQLLQSQKLEAVGQLAAGVAHDFNNLLNVITGYGELLLRMLPDGAPGHDRTEQILRAAERGASLTRQLLAFSRRQVLEPRVVDLGATVEDVQSMLIRLIGEDIRIVTTREPSLGTVWADPGQMEQVLVNLAVNARDAMPQGGALVVETANVELDDDYVRTHPGSRPGRHVRLAVSDTGHGMDAATAARIFEPFFTTKPRGKGTGLGLATVHGIVKQSGGHVDLYTEPGHGTTFKIYLPRVDEPVSAAVEPPPTAAVHGGVETIVLVEDEDGLRSLIREVLEDGGYRVIDAAAPAEGLAAAQAASAGVDLLMTDLILPQMRGDELAARVRAVCPGVRVLFMSGYTDEAVEQHVVLDPGAHFLQKPFTLAALLAKVRAVLDEPA
jgi:two-component system cell cycle sensor histidine kinase/response regulator CckA